nr:serine/arginine-rich splicing factor 4-like isoform X1 [Ipomoea batatas]
MSLHLGNISPHIRRDELESVFQRFGRCTVRLKDKFGFVVYDYPANAEKALKILRGKAICGEPITLSWSNRQPQPKPIQRFAKGARVFQPPRGKHFGRHDYVSRDMGYNGQQGHKRGFRSADINGGRIGYAEPVDELTSHHGYVEDHSFVDDFPDDSGGREATVLQNGRWEEQGLEPLNQNGLENGPHFDRPQIDVKEEERFRNSHRVRHRDSSLERTTHQSGRKDYREKKRRRDNPESTRNYSKNARAPVTNSTSSDHTASESHLHSRSLKSLSMYPSNSRPKSSPARKNSRYSSIRSGSTSHSKSSSPTSQPLSVSPDQSLSSSSNKMQIEQKDLHQESKVDILEGEPVAKNESSSDYSFKEVKDSLAPDSDIGDPTEFPHTLEEIGEFQNNNDLTLQHAKSQSQNPDVHISERSLAANAMKLSSEELCMVLKHYRLEQPEEMDKDLPIEDCLGCARLWPWEIIYYRRYKNGHISTENYTRRLAQNKEFGIVDKYVRSSSGWGEV